MAHRRAVYGRSGDLYSGDRAPHRDPAPRGPQPLPPRADRQDRGRRRTAPDLVSGSASQAPTRSSSWAARCRARDVPGPGARPGGLGPSPPSADRCRRLAGGRAGAGGRRTGGCRSPSTARASPAPGSWPSPGASTSGRWRSPRRPGAAASGTWRRRRRSRRSRTVTRALARIRAAGATPPAWLRDADRRVPIISISGTNGKTTTTRMIAAILRAAGRRVGHDLRRRARRRPAGRAGRLDRARRRQADPRPVGRRRGRPRDGARRHPAARRGLRVERRQRADQRQLRPPRPAGHPHAARAGRGQVRRSRASRGPTGRVVLNADDPLVAASARHVRAPVTFFSTAQTGPGASRATWRAAAGRSLVEDGWLVARDGSRAQPIVADRRGARHALRAGHATTSPTRWRRRPARWRSAPGVGRCRRRPAQPSSRAPSRRLGA